jgi:hypothetical protein
VVWRGSAGAGVRRNGGVPLIFCWKMDLEAREDTVVILVKER